jgi:hypothetical protein
MQQDIFGEILYNCGISNPKRTWTNEVTESTKFIILAWYFTLKQGENIATARFELHFSVTKAINQMHFNENNLEKVFLSPDKSQINNDIRNRRFFIQSYDGK